ncbi:hypothetical protein PVAP13_5KG384800 [Panicum virgatum]|uniref:Amino acid transporter transmembrane domain-containing protein n=1 Tax=Panicum virgatum TaxID=38727 RepID=A0A8T0SHJ3_PANVG|nr:hypothetical protein PVAP13_5KG384800 [Panicum virgatum]
MEDKNARAAVLPVSTLTEPLLPGKGEDLEAAQLPSYGGASFSRTCLNLTNAVSGIGVLSMPYAVAQGGWLSLALFALVGAICYYTGTLIERCMRADPAAVASYPDIGAFAFGSAGRRAVAAFMYVELYLVAISFLVLEGDNLDKLFPGATVDLLGYRLQGKQLFIALAASVVLPTTWLKNLGVLAYVSAVGLVSSAVLTVSLVWAGLAGTGFHRNSTSVLNLSGLPTSLGLYFVCFTGHAVFPTIYSSMRNNKHFSKVLLISSVLCSVNYGLTASDAGLHDLRRRRAVAGHAEPALGKALHQGRHPDDADQPAGQVRAAGRTNNGGDRGKVLGAVRQRAGEGGHQHRGGCQHGGGGLDGAVLRLPHVVHRIVPQRHGNSHIPQPLLP